MIEPKTLLNDILFFHFFKISFEFFFYEDHCEGPATTVISYKCQYISRISSVFQFWIMFRIFVVFRYLEYFKVSERFFENSPGLVHGALLTIWNGLFILHSPYMCTWRFDYSELLYIYEECKIHHSIVPIWVRAHCERWIYKTSNLMRWIIINSYWPFEWNFNLVLLIPELCWNI